ncbi:hypothetical protein LSAT2_001367, partial [Lamellibrachia satsuma]
MVYERLGRDITGPRHVTSGATGRMYSGRGPINNKLSYTTC